MLIGQLSEKSGFSRDTIRYYEKIKLIQSSSTNSLSNNYKYYSQNTLRKLAHIRDLKNIGFTLTEIAELMESFQKKSQPCAELPNKLIEKISSIDEKIKTLKYYQQSLNQIVESCDSQCVVDNGLPSCVCNSLPQNSLSATGCT